MTWHTQQTISTCNKISHSTRYGLSCTFVYWYESLSLLMSPTRKFACNLLNLLSPRRSCSGVWGSSATSSVPTPIRIIHVHSMLKEWKRPRGRPHQTWLCTIENDSNIRTWGCGRPGTELMTVISGVISWKQRRSRRGMLHDDDDDGTDFCPFTVKFYSKSQCCLWIDVIMQS